ncbi:MAG TPA: type II CRISPR-associated endonuclease Cas1, partial [Vicingus sp.]|nr:type II CRISPR-associated endonuclease Cas1 [Vicingus sp.]
MPIGLLMPLSGNSEQNERFRAQLDASVPLKKNLWQQTIQAKINNQAALLAERGIAHQNMLYWAKEVTSGDTLNHEARAAAYYWQNLFEIEGFNRYRNGIPPNNLLNYGYAILRAVCARALVSSGLFPTLGIHHANKYNAYCLADDIMEPYRPYVDMVVCFITDNYDNYEELTTELKKELLQIPALDVVIGGKKSPLMIAMSRTTNSLQECFSGQSRKIIYPSF